MKTFILVIFFAFIKLSSSSHLLRFPKNKNNTGNTTQERSAERITKPKIPADKIDAGYMKLLQTMTATNMKLKYELGEMFVKIIQEMKEEDERNAQQQEEILTSDHLNVLEHSKAAWALYDAFQAGGWGRIKDLLGNRNEKVEIKNKLLGIAIKHENINLINSLISNRTLFISYDMYKFAIRNAFLAQSEKSEMIVDAIANFAKSEIGIVPNFSNKLQLGLANIKIYDYIVENDYPMLERALREGLNANMRIPTYGSLLGLSVMSKCYRCTKLLIDFGADANRPIEYNEAIEAVPLKMEIVPKDWSPLMVAVAHGYERLISLLINHGARVTYIPPGREDERFHARAVARTIEDKDKRLSILGLLKLSATERPDIDRKVSGKSFLHAVSESDLDALDAFMLLSPTMNGTLPRNLRSVEEPLSRAASHILSLEVFILP